MIIVNTVTAICFVLLIGYVVYLCVKFIRKDRADRINFLRNFKKGNCLAIFLIAIPLVFLGYWYVSRDIILALFDAIPHVFNFVVLKYDVVKLSALTDVNLFYKITVYFCCLLVAINAALFAVSVFSQKFWQSTRKLNAKLNRKEVLYLFGYNPDNLSIYKSETKSLKYIVDKISNSDQTYLYSKKINFLEVTSVEKTVTEIFGLSLKAKGKCTVVINFENDTQNLEVTQLFINQIEGLDQPKKQKIFDQLSIYVFGASMCESIYHDLLSKACGCIQYKNKYKMLANKFVEKYPLSKFMDSNQIDYDNCCIKSNVDINVCLVGFGEINQQIFMTSVANNQFLTLSANSLINKKVNYHIFDKDNARSNRNLNHSYFRYEIEFENKNKEGYLPFPEDPAIQNFYHVNINEPEFFHEVRRIITQNRKSINFIVVSFNNDLENIDLAQKLLEKRREWELENVIIFVRIRTNSNHYSIFKEKNVIALGDEDKTIYNIKEIVGDSISNMALMRNEVYDLEYKITTDENFTINPNSVTENERDSRKNWFMKIHPIQRESNLYCCLSLRLKLNLLGLDYCKDDENDLPALTQQEFWDIYAENDMPHLNSEYKNIHGKPIINYDLNFKDSKRKNLAVLEHHRWNSFMISKGIVPASKDQILNEQIEVNGKKKFTNGKNYFFRRHGNLTTFQGLLEFRKMIAKRDHRDEIDCDVIKYDYQILDDAFWLLTSNGYKIVKLLK